MKRLILLAALSAAALASAHAQIIISEVDPNGSGTTSYAADWFELTNTSGTAVNISGWKIDDNSDSFSLAVALSGVTSIAAGQSVVFIETTGGTAATIVANFEAAWFGANIPASFTIGTYSGSGVGLGSSGDSVNIFNSAGTEITGVNFGATTLGPTLDNSAGLGGTSTATNPTLATLSVVGVHGAFTAANDSPTAEVGSPGVVPEPDTFALLGGGGLLLGAFGWKRRTKN